MPTQKNRTPNNAPASFRPGALQRERLNLLIEYRQQNQTAILNAAIDLLYLFDLGFDKMSIMRQADVLTDFGANDPAAE